MLQLTVMVSLNSQQTPHSLPVRVSYGVFIVDISDKKDHAILVRT